MNVKLRLSLFAAVYIGLSGPAFSSQGEPQQASAEKSVERITVYGTKTVAQLKKEITKSTKAFFKDYNKLNGIKQYAVICRKEKNPGSHFKSTSCEPRFVKTKRSDMLAAQQAGGSTTSLSVVDYGSGGGAGTFALSKLNLMTGAARVSVSQNKKFNEHVEKIFSENPELLEKYKEIMGLQSEYAYKRISQ